MLNTPIKRKAIANITMEDIYEIDLKIQTETQAYWKACRDSQIAEAKERESLELQRQCEFYTNLLKILNKAEKKYTDSRKEIQSLRKRQRQNAREIQGGSNKVQSQLLGAGKRYNQLLIKYNMSQSESKNLERKYERLKEKYEKLGEKKRYRFKPLLGLNMQSTSTPTKVTPARIGPATKLTPPTGSVKSGSTTFSRTPSPIRGNGRITVRENVSAFIRHENAESLGNGMAQSTPNINSQGPMMSTPLGLDDRKKLPVLSPQKRLDMDHCEESTPKRRLFNPEIESDDNEEDNWSKLSPSVGKGPTKKQIVPLFQTPGGSQRVRLLRNRGDESNNTRSSTEDSMNTNIETRIGVIGDVASNSISPLKIQNKRVRETIMKNMSKKKKI